jgi:hypothetical protein
MTDIPLHAHTSQTERASIVAGARDLVSAFGEATGAEARCEPVFVSDLQALSQSPPGTLRLASLLPELQNLDEPWAEAGPRLQALFEALTATGDPVFICTILRHAGQDEDADLLYRRRVRIRRLNLLAAELSRQTGAFIVDIDRVIADRGGRNLQADYRLDSPAATEVAGQAVAFSVTVNGLDAITPFETQERMREIIVRASAKSSMATKIVPANVLALGRGRRKQTVFSVTDSDSGSQVGRLLRQTLRREVAPAEALDKLMQAIRRRGALESGTVLAAAVLRMVRGSRR